MARIEMNRPEPLGPDEPDGLACDRLEEERQRAWQLLSMQHAQRTREKAIFLLQVVLSK